MEENRYEQERSNNVDNRVGILLSAVAVLMSFYLPALNIKRSIMMITLCKNQLLNYFFLALTGIAVILAIISVYLLCSAYIGRKYLRFDFNKINDPIIQQSDSDVLARDLINVDTKILIHNRRLIDSKYMYFEKGLFTFFSLVTLVCITLILNCFV